LLDNNLTLKKYTIYFFCNYILIVEKNYEIATFIFFEIKKVLFNFKKNLVLLEIIRAIN